MRKFSKFVLFLGIIFSLPIHAQIITPVKWAFSVKELANDEAELLFTASIDKTWHLYSQFMPATAIELPLVFEIKKNAKFKLIGGVKEPAGVKHYDEDAKADIKSFEGKAVFKQKIKKLSKDPFVVEGSLDGQACQEGKCVGTKADFSLKLTGVQGVVDPAAVKEAETEAKTDTASVAPSNETKTDTAKAVIKTEEKKDDMVTTAKKSLWIFFWLAFGGGLLAILTPCVFPMIPMTISYFMKEGKRGKVNAMIYGVWIILIYVLFGTIISVIFGKDFGNWISTHWIPNILFFVIFIIFAAAFFGYFEIRIPSWAINKSVEKEEKSGVFGTFFMALTLVLVSFSCTGPIVGTIVVASAGGEVLMPIVGMLGFSLAFALPFTLFALFPQWLNKLPKSGGWLNTVKVVLGFIELAFALKFLNIPDQTYHWGILDREVFIALWIVLFFMLGMYLIGKLQFPHDSDFPIQKSFGRFMLAIASFSFVVYMIPGMWGAPLKMLSGWVPPMETQDFDFSTIVRENSGNDNNTKLCEDPLYTSDKVKLPHGLKGYFDLDQALRCAKEQSKPLFVDFTGHGCTNCRSMENNVWSNPEVLKRLKNDFILVALYVDDKVIKLQEKDQYVNKEGKKITLIGEKNSEIQSNEFKTNSQPYYVIMDGERKQMGNSQVYDLNVNNFVKFLDEGKAAYEKAHPKK
jgi:thiol:disulfide interchange protein